MGLKNAVKAIHCKRADDILVVRPGPDAERVCENLRDGVQCGHGHLIVIGNPTFEARTDLPSMPDAMKQRAQAAYAIFPLAKVLVDTLAQQLRCGVDEVLVGEVLGHPELLDVIAKGQEKMDEHEKAHPKLGLLGADGKPIQ